MAKFNYKLQNILEIKYKLEDQAKSAYAQANENLRKEKLKLNAIYDDILKYQNRIREMSEQSVNITELRQCSDAIEIKKDAAKRQSTQVAKAEKIVEEARQKLSDVMIDRKTHEKLREKAFEEFLVELDESEKKEIDELISFTYNKSK